MEMPTTDYKDVGVDIDQADRLIEKLKPLCQKTARTDLLTDAGGFAGLFELPIAGYRQPVLLNATDGVGTKLRLTVQLKKYDTIGTDLVAMCANDILVHGGVPIVFMDYYSCGKLDNVQAYAVIEGIARACREIGATLMGGETAEMPGLYRGGEYDLAGFAIGIAEKDGLLPAGVAVGDVVIGIDSSGVHANGFSLIHHIVETRSIDLSQPFKDTDITLGETLLTPTELYIKPLLPLIEQRRLHALAHITGGGMTDNLPRVLPPHSCAEIDTTAWHLPAIFEWIKEHAYLSDTEMRRVFNCGIGMCAIAAATESDVIIAHLKKHKLAARIIGTIDKSKEAKPKVIYG